MTDLNKDNLYCVVDVAEEKALPIFQSSTDKGAIQRFKTDLQKNPVDMDFDLYRIGTFDKLSMTVTNNKAKIFDNYSDEYVTENPKEN